MCVRARVRSVWRVKVLGISKSAIFYNVCVLHCANGPWWCSWESQVDKYSARLRLRRGLDGRAGTIFRSDGLCCAFSVASHGAPDPAADENYCMGSGRTSTTVTFRDRRLMRPRLRLIHCKTQRSNIYTELTFVQGRSVASVRAKARDTNHRRQGSSAANLLKRNARPLLVRPSA